MKSKEGLEIHKSSNLNGFLSSLSENAPVFQSHGQYMINCNFIESTGLEGSIDLIVTSPPYNVDIDYNSNDDSLSYAEYLQFSTKWLERCYDMAKNDGRLCLNIPLDKNKGGMNPVYADLLKVAKDVGWNYFTTIVWNEGNISRRTAWGSWLSASAPFVIAPVEMILVMYKKQWKKLTKGVTNIERNEFMEWTNGVWTFNGESKKRVGHPAPFPIELPSRCIKLFSYEGDLILDPFVGSGSTLVACRQLSQKSTNSRRLKT
jgi:site-specific DNA-methyltransferase (adenine-specific)